MQLALCPHCRRTRVVVSPFTARARFRTHLVDGKPCPGSLQPPPALTRPKEA